MAAFPSDMEIYHVQHVLTSMRIQNWLNQDLFSPQWWLLLVGVLIIPWIVWYRLVDRGRIFEILSYGVLVAIATCFVDCVGIELGWFIYPYKLIPIIPRLLPAAYGLVPVAYMLLYQYSPSWRSFIINNTLFATLASFVMEPLAKYLGMYQMIQWNYFLSFAVYVLTAILLRWLMSGLKTLSTIETNNNPIKIVPSPVFKKARKSTK